MSYALLYSYMGSHLALILSSLLSDYYRTQKVMKQRKSEKMGLEELTEGCIANIISCTSPVDACRMSLVSPTFHSAADSDSVWDKFLPSNYDSIVSSSSSSTSTNHSLVSVASKKQLFFALCHNPILIEDSKKSFWLDKWTGKKCYMIAARDLMIAWGNAPEYWTWIHQFNSMSLVLFLRIHIQSSVFCLVILLKRAKLIVSNNRFSEVAQLKYVWWLEIRGKVLTCMLSPKTSYTAFLVFRWGSWVSGFGQYLTKVSVGTAGSGISQSNVHLEPYGVLLQGFVGSPAGPDDEIARGKLPHPKKRRDGWLEIELGQYHNECGEDGELEMSVKEAVAPKTGIIVQGIEIRPSNSRSST